MTFLRKGKDRVDADDHQVLNCVQDGPCLTIFYKEWTTRAQVPLSSLSTRSNRRPLRKKYFVDPSKSDSLYMTIEVDDTTLPFYCKTPRTKSVIVDDDGILVLLVKMEVYVQ